jgi:hypothetical protein
MRRVSIALWMLFVWCRDAGNLESAYLAAELVLLRTWDAARDVLAGNDSRSEPLGIVLQELIDLHIRISDELVVRKLLPHAAVRHGLSAAVRSAAPLDVNLQMFSLLGRIALRGLWQLWTDRFGGDLSPQPQPRRGAVAESQADRLADGLCALVGCNPTLFSPTNEEQVVDLGLAFAFLAAHGRREQDLRLWLQETIHRLLFSFSRRSRYPLPDSDYSALAEHQSDPGESFAASTAASVLIPTLALWSAGLSLTEELGVLAQLNKELDHCSMQLWLPGADSEQAIWKTADGHGMALMDIPVGAGPGEILAFVSRECGPSSHFETLSAVAQGIWPLVAVACRHNRLPVPPQMFLQAVGRQHVTEATEPPLEDTLMATNGREHGACPAAATLAE